jgi:hypothetical protein
MAAPERRFFTIVDPLFGSIYVRFSEKDQHTIRKFVKPTMEKQYESQFFCDVIMTLC